MNNPMGPNSYSLDSAQHFGGTQQQLAMGGHSKQMQIPHQSQQQQQYYVNEMSAGQPQQAPAHYPGLPPPAFAYGGGQATTSGSVTSTGGVGMVAGHHQVVNPSYDLMTGAHSSAAAAAAAARSCALPSPTIYPPTPPPSAPWVHLWFLGDTF